MIARIGIKKIIVHSISALIGLFLQLFVIYLFIGSKPNISLTIIGYIIGSVVMSISLVNHRRGILKNPYFWQYLVLTLMFPLYGSIGALCIGIYRIICPMFNKVEEDIETTYSFARFTKTASFNKEKDNVINQELWAQSYFDIIRGNDRYMKKNLISRIIRSWTPNGILLLREAILDPDYDIRSYAANALNSVGEQLMKNVLDIKKKLRLDPDNILLKLKIARAHFFFITTGIIDKVLERFYLDITRYILDEISLVIVPDNEAYIDYLSLKADFAKINNDVSNEKEIYLKILEYSPKHITATAKLCGILFDQRDFTNLKIMSENLTKLTHDDNPYVLAAKMVSASGSVPFKGDEA